MMARSDEYTQRRRPSFLSILIAILLAGILIALVAGLWMLREAAQTVQGGADRLRSWGIELIKEPTPTIRPNPATIIHQVQTLSRLETVSYSVEKVVTVEKGQQGLADLLGLDEKLLFVAHGKVIAGVDLSRLRVEDITIAGDDTVILALPEPEVFVATLDNEQSYVYDHERGILNRVFEEKSDLETLARRAAERLIEEAAIEDGILETANTNAQNYLRTLLMALGFDQVFFTDRPAGTGTDSPPPAQTATPPAATPAPG
jgi:hypothetical protein